MRYTDAEAPTATYTTDVYLILLSAMFRSLLSALKKPPVELNPRDKTLDLERTLTVDTEISLSSRLILRLLLKSVS